MTLHLIRVSALFLSLITITWGQSGATSQQQTGTPPTATAPPPAPATQTSDPATAKWSIGSIDISGLLDGYYNFNNNHPASGFNTLRNFEVKSNQFSLNMAKLSLSHAADPIGFTLDLGFGRAWQIFHATDPARGGSEYVPQAYVSLNRNDGAGCNSTLVSFTLPPAPNLRKTT